MVGGVVGELRELFQQGDFKGLISRAEQLQHRHRVGNDSPDRPFIAAARAAALLLTGKPQVARPIVKELLDTDKDNAAYPIVTPFAHYAQPYIAWASNQGVAHALETLRSTDYSGAEDSKALEAQLLYRLGRYDEAASVYRVLYDKSKRACESASSSSNAKSWSLTSRLTGSTAQQPALSSAEIEALKQAQSEVATNLMASLVLAGSPDEAVSLKAEVDGGYEIEYNSGCAAISSKNWVAAEQAIERAKALFRSGIDTEEENARGISPILVQRAYVGHVVGNVAEAEKKYAKVVRERSADPASLAVAANNAAVATGQLALAKQQRIIREGETAICSLADTGVEDGKSVEKDRNGVLFDALKKMKATSGWDVERKLTFQQRRSMARNRAVLLVQMGRLSACRGELEKFKQSFPEDECLPLVEAALVAKSKSADEADALLRECAGSDTDAVRAARVRLAIEGGKPELAAKLLLELFPGRAAALATAASVLETGGLLDESMSLLRGIPKDHPKLAIDAKRALSATLMRVEKYEEASTVLREVLGFRPTDELALGQLVVATSHFNPTEAEKLSERLPSLSTSDVLVDVESLETRPPPRRRDIRAAKSVEVGEVLSEDPSDSSAKLKKKKKKKKRLPKNYDPDGPPPDPERWLPKTLRSSYKKKKKGRELNFRGAQGADATAADAAGARNAERSAARASESSIPTLASHVPKGTKGRKKNRRR